MKIGLSVPLLVSSLVVAACSSSSGPSLDPAKTNCSNVCDRARECVNKDADVEKCTNDCDSKSSNDNVYKAKVEECANCVTPKTCSEVSSCVGDCLKVYLP